MQTKYEKYEQLSHDTLHSIAESKDNWLKFLDTASRMYKYSFDDQVLIHAQRPDTRACADFAFWTYITGFLIGLGLFIWLCVTGP